MNRLTERNVFRHLLAGVVCALLLAGCGRRQTDVFSVSLAETETAQQTTEGAFSGEESGEAQTGAADSGETEVSSENTTVFFVYICGEVQDPGVYELPAASRICDAVEAAGGFTDQAAADYWNLAEPLYDGEMIEVPTHEEADSRAAAAEPASEASAGNTESHYDSAGRLNINKATAEELQKLSGIGELKAQAILEYREEHGNFSRAAEITNVSGIGESTYNTLKDQIMVD